MKKRIYTLAAILLLAFCIFTPIQADEIERVEVECSGVLQAGGLLEEQPAVYSKARTASAVSADIDGAKRAMVAAATELQDTVNISEYNIPIEQLQAVFTDFLNENPRLFYISNLCYYLPINGYVSSINFIYEDAKSDIQTMLDQYDAEVNKILSNTKEEWSDLEKILFVNDYLALNCEYEEAVYEDPTIDAHDAYDVLVKKKAVCQGYALAFRDLMNHLNVTCELVTSDVMCHAWNIVQLEGAWYHVDVTWNDPTKDKLGRARHFYLLKSQNFFLSTEGGHNADDYVYSDSNLNDESASEKKFDTAAWNNIDSAFWYYGDCWYAIEETSNKTADLKTYTLTNAGMSAASVKKTITATWDIQGTNSYYPGSYSYTWLIGDILYYNLPKKVMAYNLATNTETTVYSFENDTTKAERIYELRVEGYEVSIGLAPNLEKDTVVTKEIIYLNHEHQYDRIVDCTVATKCTLCGQVAVKATAHIPVGEQTNCLEAVKCKVCTKNAIESKTSHSHNGVTDCTVNTMCTVCKQIAVPAREGHEAGKITDCTKATKCQHCEQMAIQAGEHTPDTIIDCTQDTLCIVCDQVAVKATAHIPVGEQTNCLEAVECKVCTKNAIEAKPFHTHNGVTDCTVDTMCTECGQIAVPARKEHEAGEITDCTKTTKCQHCEHIMIPAGSHTHGTILDCTKATPCTVCGKVAVPAKSHTPGPAATCTTNQTCTTCHALLANPKGHTPYENATEATFLNAKTVDTYCSTCHQHLSNTTVGDKLACKKGAVYTVGNYKYKIISNKTNGKGTVAFHGLAKNVSQVVIGNTVVIHGVKFNIIEISAKALKKKTKVKALTIGSNIQKIGKEAFYGMSKAKKITIKTTKLTSIGKNALKSIYKKATIKVPKSRLSKYKKLLKGKGQSSSVKITK